LILGLGLCLSAHVNAQEEGRIEARTLHITPPDRALQYVDQGIFPSGFYVIAPDNQGHTDFDPALAYALLRALDSVRAALGGKGVSASVLIPGQGTWLGVTGVSSESPAVNVNPDMLFGIGSNTKALVSTTILSLVDAGLLSLDDSLSKWLPPYPNITGTVTIRQLLSMRSGLFDYLNDSNEQGDSVAANPTRLWAPEELITTFVGPPKGAPGGSYSYCNTNYVLLGMVIQRITGKSVSSQIRERILTPLSLDHTFMEVEEPYIDPAAHPWDGGFDFASVPVIAHFSTLWTAGGVMSTAENMARWSKALHEGGVISPSSLAEMQTFVPASSNPAIGLQWTGYGLGVRQGSYYGKRILGHGGLVMGYASVVAYLPGTGAGFAVLCNATSASPSSQLTALLNAYLKTFSTRSATPGVCYAISGKSDGVRVYLADTSSGTLTLAGPSEYGELTGTRVHPHTGTFWGLSKAPVWELVKIDGQTGETFPRIRVHFPAGAPTDFKGLAFSPGGVLYVGSVDGRIYAIDTTSGAAVLAASSGLSISGLAFDPTDGALWAAIRTSASLRDRIYNIDLVTGDTLGAGNTGFNQPLADLAFDDDGNLFGLVGSPTSSLKYRLARIDKATGVGTEIGSVGLSGMVGIAFSRKPVETHVEVQASEGIQAFFQLDQNFPNPFNPTTTIAYRVGGRGTEHPASQNASVKLAIYDLLGHEVAVLVDGEKPPGNYVARWDAADRPSGVYFYRLEVWPTDSKARRGLESNGRDFVMTRKLMLLR
jgi:D-alanyl-D-alanine carboxypeptidase